MCLTVNEQTYVASRGGFNSSTVASLELENAASWTWNKRCPAIGHRHKPTVPGIRGIPPVRSMELSPGTHVQMRRAGDGHSGKVMIMSSEDLTRRGFVGAVGVAAGAASVLGAPAIGRAASANGKIRLGIIGAGSRGGQLLDSFLPQPDVELIAIADVDDRHAGETAERVKKAKGNTPDTARDYRPMLDRKDIDAVIIATPDHWHALPAIQAVMAGKDVYIEKPVAHNVTEGKAMIAAARKYKKIMAVGTQQRSSSHFQKAVEIVRSGKLGKVFWVQTWNFENISPTGMGRYPDSEAPSYVDYDRWLGPAPKRAFNPNRFHMLFRWFFDYAGGMMSDWGVHLNDIVLWALNSKGPRSVYTTGGIFTTDDARDTPDTMQVMMLFFDADRFVLARLP